MNITKGALNAWAIMSLLLAFSCATITLLTVTEQFYIEEPQLLENSIFLEGESLWQHHGSGSANFTDNKALISAGKNQNMTFFQTTTVDTPGFYRASVEITSANFIRSEEQQRSPDIILFFRNSQKDRFDGEIVVRIDKSNKAARYSKLIFLNKEIKHVDFTVRMNRSQGEVLINNPVISKLAQHPFYLKLKLALGVLWAAICIALGTWLITASMNSTRLVWILILACIVVIGILMPGIWIQRITSHIAQQIPQQLLQTMHGLLAWVYGQDGLGQTSGVVSKTGHLVVFLFIGAATRLTTTKSLVFLTAAIAVFALITEVLQMFVNDRTPTLADLFIDISAALCGLLLGACILKTLGFLQKSTKQA